MSEDKIGKKKSLKEKLELKKVKSPLTHFAISPDLRTVLLNYLNNQPRKEVNNMCVLLEKAQGISLTEKVG